MWSSALWHKHCIICIQIRQLCIIQNQHKFAAVIYITAQPATQLAGLYGLTSLCITANSELPDLLSSIVIISNYNNLWQPHVYSLKYSLPCRCTSPHLWQCVSGGIEWNRQGQSHLEQTSTGTWSSDHWLLCTVQEKWNHLLHHSPSVWL